MMKRKEHTRTQYTNIQRTIQRYRGKKKKTASTEIRKQEDEINKKKKENNHNFVTKKLPYL